MIDERIAEIALDRVGGHAFERFINAFLPSIYGDRFAPLGGINDGGADAFLEPIYGTSEATKFFQASVQEDHRAKILQTIARLNEVGRTPSELVYCTSRKINRVDEEDELLSDQTGLTIRIRDQRWLLPRINSSSQTIAAFNSHLASEVSFLANLGGSSILGPTKPDDTKTLFVFLEQELARRKNSSDVLQSTIDSLILWSLEETDPDKGKFLSRDEILVKIEAILPSSKQFIRGSIDHRLERLSSKLNESGREIRKHLGKYCLPYETRKQVAGENATDELLRIHLLESLSAKAQRHLLKKESGDLTADLIAKIADATIHRAFENQGMELAAFISSNGSIDQGLSISDYADAVVSELNLSPRDRSRAKEAALDVLRTAFYESTEIERIYFGKLSRTYTLLFTLRTDARVVEYFKGMSNHLILYVGADIVVRALSEHYLHQEDKMAENLLKIMKRAGAKLIISETALEEIYANMCISDHEFNNWFRTCEKNVTTAMARHCSKILVRSYFYAKLTPPAGITGPSSWERYIDQFATYSRLHTANGRDELREYLCRKFGFEFESEDEMLKGVNADHLEALKEMLIEERPHKSKSDILAYNDALQVLRIYAKRTAIGDKFNGNIFGYKVWWLSQEVHVTRVTGGLVKHYNARFIMRPDFLLNFIAFAPTMQEVRDAYANIFPTLLAIKLSNRMKDTVFHDVMERYRRVCELDPARVEVKTKELSDRLKGDNFKEYEVELRNEVH